MAVEDRVEEQTSPTSANARAASLSAYVDRPIADVFAYFADPDIDGLLAAAVRVALGADDELVSIHASPTLWVTSGNLRVPVTWQVRGADGGITEGTATISLLVVQSGHDAITELLVSLPVRDDSLVATTNATRSVLDELIRRLESRAA